MIVEPEDLLGMYYDPAREAERLREAAKKTKELAEAHWNEPGVRSPHKPCRWTRPDKRRNWYEES